MSIRDSWGEDIGREFEGARLGDARLVARAKRMARVLSLRPDVGFPKAFESESQLEAFYRFVNNDRVSPEGVLYGHVEETLQRAAAARLCLLVHDSSEFNYTSEREGLGRTGTSVAGFTGHFCLAVTADGTRTPLGMVALRTHARTGKKLPKRTSHARRSDAGRESQRWYEQLQATERLRGDQFDAVHVMDREADIYALIAQAQVDGTRFVIRAAQDRSLVDESFGRISEALAALPPMGTRKVELSARALPLTPSQKKRHPARRSRLAELSLASTRVTLRRPSGLQDVPSEATVNVVHVWETDTPPGEPAVEWVLLTSEPVDTLEQVAQVVDWYRARWTIEEYFKALKTGCAIEQRQLESYDALVIALAISIPIAWRLLLLRSQARERADAPATSVLNDVQLQIVATKAKVPASTLTLHLAMLAIAQMGGHLKHNGEPGWQTLWHGYEKLLLLEQGWRAARAADCDQS